MPFVKFTQSGRAVAPRVSIGKSGLISFSDGARRKFRLAEYSHVVLYYDADLRRVGVELCKDGATDGARKLRMRATGADVSAKAFIAFFGLNSDVTTSYPLQRDEETGFLTFDLTSGRVRGASRKTVP